ncbi:MAG: DUF2007 domain-containing protein [Candidatus Hydrogenedentales bacterium]
MDPDQLMPEKFPIGERVVVPVRVCYSDEEADVIQSVLRDGGIESMLNSEVPHDVLPITQGWLGKVLVLVDEARVEEAQRVIDEHLVGSEPDTDDFHVGDSGVDKG